VTDEHVANPIPSPALQPAPDPTPLMLVQLGIEKGIDVDALERLQAMAERVADRNAAAAFNAAMALFQQTCPTIEKTRSVDYGTRAGSKAKYLFANLDDITKAVRGPMHKCGLSYSFSSEMVEGGIVETCTLRHIDGHSVTSRSPVVPMDSSAGMSSQQKAGSAQTYARRYALTGALGITTGDADDDEVAIYGEDGVEKISDEQVKALRNEMKARGASESAFIEWVGITMLADMPAGKFKDALAALKRKPLKPVEKEWGE
jgi:hypothetical protein